MLLFFFGLGDSFVSLSYLFRVGRTTISEIVLDVCEAIISQLEKQYVQVSNMLSLSAVTISQ